MTASFAFLGLLHRGPSYGYDLKKTYDKLFGQGKPLAFGQVYATLARMTRDAQVTVEQAEQAGGPERKQYAITAKGQQELAAWLGKPEAVGAETQGELFVKVATAILVDRSPNEFLDAQRAAHLQKMREFTALRRKGDLVQVLRADYALFHLEADLRWIDVTAARIKQLTEELRSEEY